VININTRVKVVVQILLLLLFITSLIYFGILHNYLLSNQYLSICKVFGMICIKFWIRSSQNRNILKSLNFK